MPAEVVGPVADVGPRNEYQLGLAPGSAERCLRRGSAMDLVGGSLRSLVSAPD